MDHQSLNMAKANIPITSQDELRILLGTQDEFLRQVRETVGVDIVVRGDELRIQGDDEKVQRGVDVLERLQTIVEQTGSLYENQVFQVLSSKEEPLEPGVISKEVALDGDLTTDQQHSSQSVTTKKKHIEAMISNKEDLSEEDADINSSNGDNEKPEYIIDLFEKGRKIIARSPGQRKYLKAIRAADLVLCAGPAGCGKTYLAVAMAINALRQEQIRKIVLVRPAVEAGEKLGFLPGDLLAKVNPYLRPLLDALNEMLDYEQVQRYMERDIIEVVPLAFMRGRTLNNTFIILDEGQNTTVTQMKMFLTRMGKGSKIIVTGDVTQTDLPEGTVSGLTDAIKRLQPIDGVNVVRLSGGDIVRHRLVREVVRAYDEETKSTSDRKTN